mmetsp:Transcript_56484/g.131956  ORF Transcript_56484/g.131956 Transcript_56484/m.131956 type:complete len:248 (+) Transcript_56484:811-1554(+)
MKLDIWHWFLGAGEVEPAPDSCHLGHALWIIELPVLDGARSFGAQARREGLRRLLAGRLEHHLADTLGVLPHHRLHRVFPSARRIGFWPLNLDLSLGGDISLNPGLVRALSQDPVQVGDVPVLDVQKSLSNYLGNAQHSFIPQPQDQLPFARQLQVKREPHVEIAAGAVLVHECSWLRFKTLLITTDSDFDLRVSQLCCQPPGSEDVHVHNIELCDPQSAHGNALNRLLGCLRRNRGRRLHRAHVAF